MKKTIFAAISLVIFTGAAYSSSFYFIQVTDTHFGHKNHFQLTRKIFSEIKKLSAFLKA